LEHVGWDEFFNRRLRALRGAPNVMQPRTILSILLLLVLCNEPHALEEERAKRSTRRKTVKTFSPDTAALKREHPTDPVKWFEQVNVHFKAGDKARVRVTAYGESTRAHVRVQGLHHSTTDSHPVRLRMITGCGSAP
jgi:hypothetical protein